MTTSQQPRYGRHARPDEPGGSTPSEPSSVPSAAPWSMPPLSPVSRPVPPQRPSSDRAARPRSVGEYVAQVRGAGPSEPGFGEWPFGARKREQDDEPVGPNPYLPSAWLSMFALAGVGSAGAGLDQGAVPVLVR